MTTATDAAAASATNEQPAVNATNEQPAVSATNEQPAVSATNEQPRSRPQMTPDYQLRRRRLLAEAESADLEAMAVVPGPNMVYLTGLHFHLSERVTLALLRSNGDAALVLPALEQGKAASGAPEVPLFTYTDREGPAKALKAALSSLGLRGRALGVEERRIRFLELDLMAHSGEQPALWGADAVFARLRSRKGADEIEAMREAVRIAETAWHALQPRIAPDITEKELANELTIETLRAGSDPDLPFFPIVASGPNGANPHAVPTNRPLAPGDLVTIDWGARHNGYCADITRTLAVAGAPVADELQAAYDAVRAGNAAARAAASVGVTPHAVDRAARSVIEDAGFGEYFVHRTGHGLGLEGHEEPDIKEGDHDPLAEGAAFTIEPGVYVPGLGGVRIEDDVVIVDGRGVSLTTLPRELVRLG